MYCWFLVRRLLNKNCCQYYNNQVNLFTFTPKFSIMKNTIILFTVTLFSCALQAQTTAFTVLAAKGSALSQRADNPDNYINLKTGTEIFSGDKIIISDSKTYLGIVDGKGNTMELKKAGVYNSSELLKALEMSKGTLAQKYIDYLVKNMTKESEAAAHNMSVTGAVDRSTNRSQINIFVPTGLEAYQGKAAIKWLGLQNAESYEIVFLNMFDEVILREKTTEAMWTGDLSKLQTEPGDPVKVRVNVVGESDASSKPIAIQMTEQSKRSMVKEEAPADAQNQEGNSAVSNLVVGAYYQKHGLHMNALYYFHKARTAAPGVEAYEKAYNNLLYVMGMQ